MTNMEDSAGEETGPLKRGSIRFQTSYAGVGDVAGLVTLLRNPGRSDVQRPTFGQSLLQPVAGEG